MTKRKQVSPEALDASSLPKQRKPIPHAFVLDAISTLSPYTRPMFGCVAIYVKDKIVLILRDKPTNTEDNGVWLATTQEHHQSLRREFPNMRSIQVLGKRVTGRRVLSVDAPDFESAALRACELVLAGDARIGKIPGEVLICFDDLPAAFDPDFDVRVIGRFVGELRERLGNCGSFLERVLVAEEFFVDLSSKTPRFDIIESVAHEIRR
jgi:hypothetical protein